MGKEIQTLIVYLDMHLRGGVVIMRTIISISILAIFVSLPSSVGAQATCKTADEMSSHFGVVLNRMMTAERAVGRTQLGLPLVDSTQIVLVSDAAVCARAGEALDSLSNASYPELPPMPPSSRPLYVFKVGSAYAVIYLPPDNTGDGDLMFIFDSAWKDTGIGLSQ